MEESLKISDLMKEIKLLRNEIEKLSRKVNRPKGTPSFKLMDLERQRNERIKREQKEK